ncbi:MAG: ATP-binding cassette domain-containing protein [Anaerolineales bacterium]|nr:ATP-binding cassette domain-containing protein [Anaerolineales bacterium]
MEQSENVILANGLIKRFGTFTAVGGIDFTVRRAEIFGFLGPNGSGKTTTIRMTLGLLQPTEGYVETLGVDVTRQPDLIRPRVGYMSQRFSLYNDLKVLENLRFYGRVYGLRNKALSEGIGDALEMAGLTGRENTLTRDLSGGWRQRLALAASILHRPELLFLDEPTAGVDPVSRRAFWDLLYHLVNDGTTVFVTTHYMDEAEHCHRLGLIQRGQIIAAGSPKEIKSHMMKGEVLEVVPSNPTSAVKVLRVAQERGYLGLHDISLYGDRVHVVAPEVKKFQTVIKYLLNQAGIDPGEMAVIEPTLEDVFVACMK